MIQNNSNRYFAHKSLIWVGQYEEGSSLVYVALGEGFWLESGELIPKIADKLMLAIKLRDGVLALL